MAAWMAGSAIATRVMAMDEATSSSSTEKPSLDARRYCRRALSGPDRVLPCGMHTATGKLFMTAGILGVSPTLLVSSRRIGFGGGSRRDLRPQLQEVLLSDTLDVHQL